MIAIATAYRYTYGELLKGRTDGHNKWPGLVPSVLSQTSEDWKWYISADPTSEQLNELHTVASADERITLKVEECSTDMIGKRKQQAFNMIKDEQWCISLDSDDFLLPEAVRIFTKAAAVVEEEGSPTPALVSWYRRCSELSNDSWPHNVSIPMPLTFDNLSRTNWLHAWGVCHRVEAVREVGGYRTSLYVAEDYHLQALLAAKFGRLGEVRETLYGRIIRNHSWDMERLKEAVNQVKVDLSRFVPRYSCGLAQTNPLFVPFTYSRNLA